MTDSVARPFSVRVFLPGGDPDGVRVIEKTNWSGIGVVIPRPLLGESKGRPEMDRTAVYVLVGPGEDSPLPRVYIGEADVLRPRLVQHQQQTGKDFWTHAVAFTSKDANLNKAHVKHLESRLVELAKASKQCVLENSTAPGVLLGKSSNGRVEWKAADGRTLKDIQDAENE